MKYDYHIIVLGAGSAGLVVTSAARALGAKVALIEADKMGGDCLNTGCVPSKAFLKCAHLAKDIQLSEKFGIKAQSLSVNIEDVMSRVKDVVKSIEPHDSVERYESMGVDVFKGIGKFIDSHKIEVNDKIITAKHIVIATGSKAFIPNIPGLKDVPFLTNENIFEIKKLPNHLIVLGGGPIGLELGQGFRHLGSKVTIIDINKNLFIKDDIEVATVMEKKMLEDGIDLKLGAKIIKVKKEEETFIVEYEVNGEVFKVRGDNLLASLGRAPNTQGLELINAGIETDKRGYVITNSKLATNIKNIYACGDITGPYQFTHMAGYQAGIVIRNIIFKLGAKVNYSAVAWTTYTKPEVAHVGYTEARAKSIGLFKESIIVDLEDNDRAKAENDIEGFLKLIIGKKGKIIGATLVGEKAGEIIPIATLAIKQKLDYYAFMGIIFSYPTEAEIFLAASLKKRKTSIKKWQIRLVQSIFLS